MKWLRRWWYGDALWEEITEIEVALIETQQRLDKIERVLGGK